MTKEKGENITKALRQIDTLIETLNNISFWERDRHLYNLYKIKFPLIDEIECIDE